MTPAAQRYPSIYHFLAATAEAQPEHTALRLITALEPAIDSHSVSYRELMQNINRSARLLQALSGKARPVCSFLLPNIPQAHYAMWGAESVGVVNPLNPLLNEEALANLMSLADTDVVIALGPNPASDIWQKAQAVVARLDKPVTLLSALLPAEGYRQFESLLPHYSDEPLAEAELPGLDHIASYFHTGGTTGTPKLAQNTHRNQLACVDLQHQSMQLGQDDRLINGLPLFHVAGSMVNSLACLCAGAEVILPTVAGFRDPTVIAKHWQLVQQYRVTVSGGIPTSVAAMVDTPVGDADISSLKYLIGGGAPVSAPLCEDVRRVLGRELYQIYGMTECAGGITMPELSAPSVPGSAGHVSDLIQVQIDGVNAVGASGEVLVKGDVVFPGYLGHSDNPLQDGWLRTGDLGHIDAAGYLFITGRAKDVIIRSGHNIDPALIENCLEQHPAVAMAAAVGKPDDYAGELPVAFVQLYEGKSVDEAELMAFAADNIAERPACPKFIRVLPSLPTTAVGKVHKPSLRGQASIVALQEQLPGLSGCQLSATQLNSGAMQVTVSGADTELWQQLQGLAAKYSLELAQG
ncbi:MAG: AMP-binding protein [Cellvibrionaceae bacterium]|nr:AMP-binding protein [Cellvibrionaceae bacterium]